MQPEMLSRAQPWIRLRKEQKYSWDVSHKTHETLYICMWGRLMWLPCSRYVLICQISGHWWQVRSTQDNCFHPPCKLAIFTVPTLKLNFTLDTWTELTSHPSAVARVPRATACKRKIAGLFKNYLLMSLIPTTWCSHFILQGTSAAVINHSNLSQTLVTCLMT